MSDILQA